jgi:superfamily II DNA or RNA helicase
MQLRDYQTKAIDAVLADWEAGQRETLLVMATGLGKTNTFLSLIMHALDRQPGARALVLAHRKELIDQPLERLRLIDPAWLMAGPLEQPRVGVIQAERRAMDRQLTIATVQSLNAKRTAELLKHGPITHLVVDECHHSTAPSYLRIREQLLAANPDLLHLGVTATPLRSDGDGLARVYQKTSAIVSIADGVRRHFLVQPRWLAISTGISISGVHTRGGDFVAGELAEAFDTPAGRRIIVGAYQQYAAGRRAIAFTASVAGAHALAAAFRDVGIVAAAIDGTTPQEERDRILGDFRAGAIQIVANCEVLTEGFDAPGTNCILMCRPTRSDGRYIQAIGRGLRPANGVALEGEDCLILDFVPAETRNIIMAGDVLGLPNEQAKAVRELLKEADDEPGEAQLGFTFDGEHFDTSGTPLEIVARQLDYLTMSTLAWFPPNGTRAEGEALTIGLGEGADGVDRILAIRDGCLYGIWRRRQPDGRPGSWQVRQLDCSDPYEEAERVAERHGAATLMRKAAGWRGGAITEGQERYLRSLARGRLSIGEIRQMGKGQAAGWISHLQATDALTRYCDRSHELTEASI